MLKIAELLTALLLSLLPAAANAQGLTLVELNCENLFDCHHDEGKQDEEFLPGGSHRWTPKRYWRKLNGIGQTILSCTQTLPDLVALVEVENDTVVHDLCRRSLLRNAGYRYLNTESPDVRGLDVTLLYQPAVFRPICYETITVAPIKNMRPTRDILYVRGQTLSGDTLHVFVVHAPSRYGGELESRPHRLQVARLLTDAIAKTDGKNIVITGDFNDYPTSASLKLLERAGLKNITAEAEGKHGARGTYRFRGEWRSLDHVLTSPDMAEKMEWAVINDAPFLTEEDTKFGGKKPRRTYNGPKYNGGYSDHLPLVVRFR